LSNTITLPRADWEVVVFVLGNYIYEHRLEGGSISLIRDNIESQLDNQEY